MKYFEYNINNFTDVDYNKWFSLLDDDLKNRISGFKFDLDRIQSVAGYMLAIKGICERCEVDVEKVMLSKTKKGKPYAIGLDVHFNISHSHDMVVCVVDDTPVGVDIEKIRAVNLNVAKRICSDNELLYIFGRTPNNSDFNYCDDINILTRFFKIWTSKEAYGKLIGEGISLISHDTKDINASTIIKDGYVISICK